MAISLALAPFSFGVIQFRLAEMFNHLAIFNKKYIWAVTIGCLIVNMFSPMGAIDIVFGTLGTLLMTSISYYLAQKVKSVKVKLIISTIVCTIATWSVALELNLIMSAPFLITYLTVALGELLSMIVGAFLIYLLNKRFDFSK